MVLSCKKRALALISKGWQVFHRPHHPPPPPLFCHQSFNPRQSHFHKVTHTCSHLAPKVNWTAFALVDIITPHPKHSSAEQRSRPDQARLFLHVTCSMEKNLTNFTSRWSETVITQWKAVCSAEGSSAERTEFLYVELLSIWSYCMLYEFVEKRYILCVSNAKSLILMIHIIIRIINKTHFSIKTFIKFWK